MSYDAFTKRLFGDHGVPEAFRTSEGFGLADGDDYYPFGDNQLHNDDDIYEMWGGSPENGARLRAQVLIFLHGGDGFLYGLWSHDGERGARRRR